MIVDEILSQEWLHRIHASLDDFGDGSDRY